MNNYERIIMESIAMGKLKPIPGMTYNIQCLHDSWCATNNTPPGECNCDVEVTVTYIPNPATPPILNANRKD